MSRIKQVSVLGQQVWLDYLSRELIDSGRLARMIGEDAIAGVTSNPAIFLAAVSKDPAYRAALEALPSSLTEPEARFEALAIPDIRRACDVFAELYESSGGSKGFVSFEVSPRLACDAQGTIEAGKRLWAEIGRPNAMIKVPATERGLQAIRELTAAGVNVNVTLMFSPAHCQSVADAYCAGLADRNALGLPLAGIRSVASVFISRIDTKLDPQLGASGLAGKVAVAFARQAYSDWKQRFAVQGDFGVLAQAGANPQSLLWASTGTKNPAYSDVLYVESLIGPGTVNTVPEATLDAFRDHGRVAATLESSATEDAAVLEQAARLGVDLDTVGIQLQQEGLALFDKAFDDLLRCFER